MDEYGRLLASRKTHRAIFFTVLTMFVIYLLALAYMLVAPGWSFNPLLAIGVLVLFSGMLPSYLQIMSIENKLKQLKRAD